MRWEYRFKILDHLSGSGGLLDADAPNPIDESEQQLNALGAEGWEVIAVMPRMGKNNSWTIALLKRAKSSN